MSKSKQRPKQTEKVSPQPAAASASPSAASAAGPWLENLSSGKTIAFFVGLLFVMGLIIFKDFFTLRKFYIFIDTASDSYTQVYTDLVHFADYFRANGLPQWSFQQGAGQNIFPMWFDVFNLIPILVGKSNIPGVYFFVEFAMLLIGATAFYHYLRLVGLGRYVAIVGGVLLAYSGYIVMGSWHNRFIGEFLYFSLLLYGLEVFIQRRVWWHIPLVIALMSATQPFWLYLAALFILLYVTVRVIDLQGFNLKNLTLTLSSIAALGALGVLMGSVFFVASINQILNSPRVLGGAGYGSFFASQPIFGLAEASEYGTILTRFFSNDLYGTASGYKGWFNYLEAPFHYCGIVVLILIPQLFHFVDNRRKWAYGILLTACAIPLLLPYFRYAFWAFTGNYYRTMSLFMILLLLFLSMQALHLMLTQNKVYRITLLVSVAVAAAVLFVPFGEKVELDTTLRNVVLVFLGIYTLIFLSWSHASAQRLRLYLLLGVVVIELTYQHSHSLSKRVAWTPSEMRKRDFFNDYSLEAIDYLKKIDKTFFRIEKDSPVSANDGKAQNFFSTVSYHSFNQLNYVRFLQATGVIDPKDEISTRWLKIIYPNFFLQNSVNVKYMLTKLQRSEGMRQMGFDSVASFENVSVYRSHYYLPLGYTYDRYLSEEDFGRLKVNESKHLALLNAVVVPSQEAADYKGLEKMTFEEADSVKMVSFGKWENIIADRRADTLAIGAWSDNFFKGTIQLKRPKLLYFSIPFDEGWQATVNGTPTPLRRVNIGMSGLMLPAGSHTVHLYYSSPYLGLSGVLSLLGFVVFGAFFWKSRSADRKQIST